MNAKIERAVDEAQAVAAAVAFMSHFDGGDADAAAALCADDAMWHRLDGPVQGKAELIRLIKSRDPALIVRHVISNFRTEWKGADHLILRSYVTLFKHRAANGAPALPVALEGVSGFGRYEDELMRSGGSWLIKRKTSVSEFKS